jgi:hypothetical protein
MIRTEASYALAAERDLDDSAVGLLDGACEPRRLVLGNGFEPFEDLQVPAAPRSSASWWSASGWISARLLSSEPASVVIAQDSRTSIVRSRDMRE